MFCNSCFESSSILNPYEFLYRRTILKYNNRRDRHDAKLSWNRRVSIDIVLHNHCFFSDFCSKILKARKHNLTRTTPLSPKINKSNPRGYIRREFSVSRNFDRHKNERKNMNEKFDTNTFKNL